MINGFEEGDIIYIKYMKFAGTNKIDYRVNGRPYLIYKIEDGKFYLLKIGSTRAKPLFYFSKVNIIKKGKVSPRESYVDMNYFIVVDAIEIDKCLDSMFYDKNPHKRRAKHGSKISSKQLKEVSNQIKILEKIKEIKTVYVSKDYDFF